MENVNKILESEEEMANIRNDIRTRYPDLNFPNVTREPLWYGRDTILPVDDGFDAIFGTFMTEEGEDSVRYAFASNEYFLLEHEFIIWMTEQVIHELPEFGKPEFKPSVYSMGGRLRLTIDFPDHKREVANVGDYISARLHVNSSYDMSKKFEYDLGGLVLSCSNGVVAFRRKAGASRRHVLALDMSDMVKQISGAMTQFSEEMGIWESWTKVQLKAAEAEEILIALPFGEKHKEEILALPEATTKETLEDWMRRDSINLWGMNSIITQFMTHEIESEAVRAEKEPIIARVMSKIGEQHTKTFN